MGCSISRRSLYPGEALPPVQGRKYRHWKRRTIYDFFRSMHKHDGVRTKRAHYHWRRARNMLRLKVGVHRLACSLVDQREISMSRHKCFISYHHADEAAVKAFVDKFDHFHNLFIVRRLGEMPDDIINSNNTDYVMSRIRADYIKDSTVTIVLMGKCTWSRRYIDWELQSSLRSGNTIAPNGLLGIKLPTFTQFPERFKANLLADGQAPDTAYAGYIDYPTETAALQNCIDWAFNRRATHRQHIKNPKDRLGYNRQCG